LFSTYLRSLKFLILLSGITISSLGVRAEDQARNNIILTTDSILSAGYSQGRLIRDTISPHISEEIVLNSNPDSLARINMLLNKEADACFCGPVAYMAQEGLSGFDDRTAGPQPVRLLLSSSSAFAMTFALGEDIKNTDLSSLKGKRVAWLRKDHQFNFHTTALLAYAGLNWQNVQQVVFPDYKSTLEGFERNYVDALLVLSSDTSLQKLLEGKRKLKLAAFSAANKTAWKRVQSLAPYLSPQTSPQANGIPAIEGVTYAYPNLISASTLSTEKAYKLTRNIVEQFDNFAGDSAAAEGWNILFQNFFGSIPFHDGSVQYFKELNIWSDEAEQHRNKLLSRQKYLMQVFEQLQLNEDTDQDFPLTWRNAREAALIARESSE